MSVMIWAAFIAIIGPVFLALLLHFNRESRAWRNFLVITGSAFILMVVGYIRYSYFQLYGPFKLDNLYPVIFDFFSIGYGINFRLTVEPIGLMFAMLAAMLLLPNAIYAIGYLESNKEENLSVFFMFLFLAIAGVMGIAFSGNLLTLLFFYEILTIVTYPLVTYHKNARSLKAGILYIFELMAPSVLFLLMIVFAYKLGGSGDFMASGLLSADQFKTFSYLLVGLCLFGVTKVALVPFHRWLPNAMVAPTPVSALLHAVAVVKAGICTILKVSVYIFGIHNLNSINFSVEHLFSSNMMQVVACITILWATIKALNSREIKSVLAYSTIVNLSYIVAVLATFSEVGVSAALFHMTAHGFAKITLFFAAGSIYTTCKHTLYKDLGGLMRRMPITMGCFAIASASIIGVPFTVGYLSKGHILASTAAGMYVLPMIVIMISTVATSIYLPRIFLASYGSTALLDSNEVKESSYWLLIPMVFTASMTLLLSFLPNWIVMS